MRPTTELNWTFCSYQEFSYKMNFQSKFNVAVHKLEAVFQFYPLQTESLTDWILQHWSDIPDMLALVNNCAFRRGRDLVSASVTTRSNYLNSLYLLKASLYAPWLEYIAFGWGISIKVSTIRESKVWPQWLFGSMINWRTFLSECISYQIFALSVLRPPPHNSYVYRKFGLPLIPIENLLLDSLAINRRYILIKTFKGTFASCCASNKEKWHNS